jgi:hypothetical protein
LFIESAGHHARLCIFGITNGASVDLFAGKADIGRSSFFLGVMVDRKSGN